MCPLQAASPSDGELLFLLLLKQRFSGAFPTGPKRLVHYNTTRREGFSRLEVMNTLGSYGLCFHPEKK